MHVIWLLTNPCYVVLHIPNNTNNSIVFVNMVCSISLNFKGNQRSAINPKQGLLITIAEPSFLLVGDG